MHDEPKGLRLTLKQRLVMRLLGIKISKDGQRWTAPRKHKGLVEQAFEQALVEAWREDKDAELKRSADGLTFSGPKRHMTLRWMP